MFFSRPLFVLVLSFIVSGCANNPATLSLAEPIQRDVVVVSEPISHMKTTGLAKITTEFGLLPGAYSAYKENNLGKFYLGEGRPVWIRNHDRPSMPYLASKGGFWVPTDRNAQILLFAIGEERGYQYETFDHMRKDQGINQEGASDPVQQGIDTTVNNNIDRAFLTGKPVVGTAVGSIIGAAIVYAAIQSTIGELVVLEGSDGLEFDDKIRRALNDTRAQ